MPYKIKGIIQRENMLNHGQKIESSLLAAERHKMLCIHTCWHK